MSSPDADATALGPDRTIAALRVAVPVVVLPAGLWLAWRAAPAGWSDILATARGASPWWLLAAFAAQTLHLLGYALLFRGALQIVGVSGPALRVGHLLSRALVWTAADRVAPVGGLGGVTAVVAVMAADPEPARVAPSSSAPALALAYAIDYSVFAVLAVGTMVGLAFGHIATRGEMVSVVILCAVVAIGLVALAALARSGRVPWIKALRDALPAGAGRRSKLATPVAGCLIREIGDALTLYAACRAVGLHLPLWQGAVVYMLSGVSALISFVPQGVGVIEASATYLLRTFGYAPGPALAGTLLYRAVGFWLPIPLGGLALLLIRASRRHPVERRAVRHPRWAALVAAALTGSIGVMNIVTALVKHAPIRRRLVEDVFGTELLHAGRTLVVFIGLSLLYMAAQLARRKRRAWQFVVWALAISGLLHLVKGLDYEEALLCFSGVAFLWTVRCQFTAGHDPASLLAAARGLLLAVAAVMVYGFAGFAMLHGQFGGQIGRDTDYVTSTLTWFFTFDNSDVFPRTARARWFVESLDVIGMAAMSAALLAAMRPILQRSRPTEQEREEARAALVRYGRLDIAHFCLLDDKSYFWNASRTAFIAYKTVGNIAIALGDPITPDDEAFALAQAFIAMCETHDWRPAFYQVTPAFGRVAEQAGLSLLKIGEDALLALQAFTLEGKQAKSFRQTLSSLERQGVTARMVDLASERDALGLDLERISSAWLRAKHGSEKTFSLGYFDLDGMERHPLMVAFDAGGRPVAFESLVPMYAADGYAGDLNRCLPDAPKRIQEFLILNTARWLKEKRYRWYGQGLAPLATTGDPTPGDPPMSERAVALLFRHFNVFYGFIGLRAFKEKFGPIWESRYLAYPGLALLPKVAAAIIRADSREGLLSYLRLPVRSAESGEANRDA